MPNLTKRTVKLPQANSDDTEPHVSYGSTQVNDQRITNIHSNFLYAVVVQERTDMKGQSYFIPGGISCPTLRFSFKNQGIARSSQTPVANAIRTERPQLLFAVLALTITKSKSANDFRTIQDSP
jgi:hypothetical protein